MEEIDQTVRGALQFIPVDHVDQVLANALEHPPLAQAQGMGESLTTLPESPETHTPRPQA